MEASTLAGGGWSAYPDFKGWRPGENTMQVVAKFPDHFLGAERVAGGEVVKGPFKITVASAPGTHADIPVLPQPATRQVLVPGLGLPVLVAGIVGLAFVARKRQARAP
jgi:hypothetical protein